MLAAVIYHSDHLEPSEQFVEQVDYPVRGDANLPRKLSLTPALGAEPPQAARSACQSLVFPCASHHNVAIYWRTRGNNSAKYSYRYAREA
jgi:hypothetical protein